MISVADDPIIQSMERTGLPPWMQEDEDDDYSAEPWAVYDP